MHSARSDEPHWVIVGGGLAGGLLALTLLDRAPRAAVTLIEQGGALGGEHTWSFHEDDVPESARARIDPLVISRWPGYQVRFPGFERRLRLGYGSISSGRFDEQVQTRLHATGATVMLRRRVQEMTARHVVFTDGTRLDGDVVVDARGPRAEAVRDDGCGYQKFVGVEVELEQDAAEQEPCLMDATVPQLDGYRFLYVLPFERRRLLVEDTYFADGPALDATEVRDRVFAYIDQRGWRVRRVLREERGVLPMPWRQEEPAGEGGPVVIGYAGGWFHPATGYSLPVALRVADTLATARTSEQAMSALDRLREPHAKQARFARLLNRLLFTAMPADQRWAVLARFYRLPEESVARFYALETSAADRLRILCGRPPRGLSLRSALFPEVNA